MPSFTYLDKHPQWSKNNDWYTSTNEDVPGYLKSIPALLGDGKDHIASICSGGDLPIMMLPFVKSSMMIVDHAKKSMVWAMLKVLILEQLGAERCKALMIGPWKEFDAVAKPLLSLLPGDIAACYYDASLGYSDKSWVGIQSVWGKLTLPDLAAATHQLHKMTFIHGDFNLDLVPPEGGFDAAYVSNMHDHQDRSKCSPDWNKTLDLVKIGAPILGASGVHIWPVNPRITPLSPHQALKRIA